MWFVTGLIAGACIGMLVMAVVTAGKDGDDR